MNETTLVGKRVVSLGDGAQVGTVKDLVFHGLLLKSLLVKGEHGEGLLPFASILKNGPDAITIDSYSLIDWNAGKSIEPNNVTSHDLYKLTVVDSEGKDLGKVHDIVLDPAGSIQELVVRTEGVFGIGSHETVVPKSGIRTIGAALITVDAQPTK